MAIKIVVIGYGAIGRRVVEELGKLDSSVAVCGVLVKPSRLAETRAALSERVAVLTDAVDALRLNPDLIVECAGQEAVVAYGEEILAAGCDLMVIAIGALADDDLRARLVDAARGTVQFGDLSGRLRAVARCLKRLNHRDYFPVRPYGPVAPLIQYLISVKFMAPTVTCSVSSCHL